MNVNADDILMRIVCTDNMAHKKVNERHAVGQSIILRLIMPWVQLASYNKLQKKNSISIVFLHSIL